MSPSAIEASHLFKHYPAPKRWRGMPTWRERNQTPVISWALEDVSFRIPVGQTCAVIGHNGAGKSTLLRVLSRVSDPSAGSASVRGKVASLLGVEAGFHPELSGRENILLNAALLGMKRRVAEARMAEIADFGELREALDLPLKFYSSGMQARLAFSVAVFQEPDILLVDEVLANVDEAFERRMVQRLGDLARQGKTVVFVSHDQRLVLELCSRAILLESGRLVFDGSVDAALERYRGGV